jgi:hypothetical protein
MEKGYIEAFIYIYKTMMIRLLMYNSMKTTMIIVCIMLSFLSCQKEKTDTTVETEENYGYENWPGKDDVVKTDIEFPNELISKYHMSLASGASGTYFFYKVPLYENDIIKNGRLQAQVFSSIDTAQLALVNYLNLLTTPLKPPRLTNENYKAGDVAFGENKDGILWMAFTRNNVIVIIHAQTEKAGDIANEIDTAIQNAPEWDESMPEPSFILP